MLDEANVIHDAAEPSTSTYDSFCNPEVIVTTYGDKRLACLIDWPCRFEQACDGPTFVVIRPEATDEQLGKLVDRFGLDMDYLKAFRTHHAT
ncbi:hypothetical protein [Paraburkholderia saeva]|uniref:Uncharacterized protein n=1 Tax=Paraburkholderia saeva TaxID=2777537 RepID=A0A9N8RYI9_9BURK|nr:hypothetical protein [Paraburkholderia saeva]CAG4903311.1 hypothetical protein LMG31841_03217 [Paraburkholderia saeva]